MFSVVDESPIGGFWIHESGGEGSWRVGEHTSRGQGLHINETRKNNIIVASYFLQHCRNYLYSLFNKRRDEGMRGSKRRCVSSNPFLALERCDANPGKSFKVKALLHTITKLLNTSLSLRRHLWERSAVQPWGGGGLGGQGAGGVRFSPWQRQMSGHDHNNGVAIDAGVGVCPRLLFGCSWNYSTIDCKVLTLAG